MVILCKPYLWVWFGGILSQNKRLVEYFLDEFYRRNPVELEHIISPSFKFVDSTKLEHNFAQYIEQLRIYMPNVNVIINKIDTEDDVGFLVDFSFEITNSTAEYGKKITDSVLIQVKNNLIESVVVIHDPGYGQVSKFKAIL